MVPKRISGMSLLEEIQNHMPLDVPSYLKNEIKEILVEHAQKGDTSVKLSQNTIVDDECNYTNAVSKWLRDEGFTVATGPNHGITVIWGSNLKAHP